VQTQAIITVVNSFSPTSIEFYEFLLYRARHFKNERHYFLVLGPVGEKFVLESQKLVEQQDVTIIECGGKYRKFIRKFFDISSELKRQMMPALLHVHMGRSGVLALLLNLMKGFKKWPSLYTLHTLFNGCRWQAKIPAVIIFLLVGKPVCVSKSAYNALPCFIRWLRKKRLEVVLNGVDIDWIDQTIEKISPGKQSNHNKEESLEKNGVTLLNVGRLDGAKNQSYLLEILEQLPENVKLEIVGEGALRNVLERQIIQRQLSSRVTLTGMLPREDVFKKMLQADIFVSSSIREGLPIAVLEAMACRLPVLLSDIGPHQEIKDKGSSVILLPFNTSEWVKCVMDFISGLQIQQVELGKQNRDIVQSYFTLKLMHQGYTSNYEYLWDISKKKLRLKG